MNALLASGITALFSFWVWDLKQQLNHEGDGLVDGHREAPAAQPTLVRHPVRRPTPQAAPAVGQSDSTGNCSRKNGVATWTIA